MPPFQYWTSSEVAPLVLQFLLSATLAIVAFYSGVPKWLAVGAVILMVVVVGWTWYGAAAKAQNTDEQRTVVATLILAAGTVRDEVVTNPDQLALFQANYVALQARLNIDLKGKFPDSVVQGVMSGGTDFKMYDSRFNSDHNQMLNDIANWVSHLRELSYRLT